MVGAPVVDLVANLSIFENGSYDVMCCFDLNNMVVNHTGVIVSQGDRAKDIAVLFPVHLPCPHGRKVA